MVNNGIASNTLNSSEYVYDYFLKDHLGNIRVVLTSEITKTDYIATMEIKNHYIEEATFDNVEESREVIPPDYPYDPTYAPNENICTLNKANGKTIGQAKVLEVKQRDKIDFDFNTINQFLILLFQLFYLLLLFLNGFSQHTNNRCKIYSLWLYFSIFC